MGSPRARPGSARPGRNRRLSGVRMLEASQVLGVVDEILARSHDFFEKNVLTLHEEDLRNALEDGLPASGVSGLEEFDDAVRRAWEGRGVRYELGGSSDPVARELLRSISDSVRSELTPGVGRPEALDLAALLRSEYTEIVAPSGSVRGFIRRGGNRPLLVLNALGLSIKIWSRLLSGEHGYKVIVPALPSCDPIAGGIPVRDAGPVVAGPIVTGNRSVPAAHPGHVG